MCIGGRTLPMKEHLNLNNYSNKIYQFTDSVIINLMIKMSTVSIEISAPNKQNQIEEGELFLADWSNKRDAANER